MSDLASHIKPQLDEQNAASVEFEARLAEHRKFDEAIARFDSCRDASRQSAEVKNANLRELIRNGAQPKEVLKCQAARNGDLEDAENFQLIADEQRKAQKGATLALYRAAEMVMLCRARARSTAIEYLKAKLAEGFPTEFFSLFELLLEEASAGDSAYFNADQSVTDVAEFAAREVAKLVSGHLVNNRNRSLGSSSFLPDLPSGLNQFKASPLQLEQMARDIAEGSK